MKRRRERSEETRGKYIVDDVEIGASVEKKLHHLRVSVFRRIMERCPFGLIDEVGVSVSIEEKFHRLRLSVP